MTGANFAPLIHGLGAKHHQCFEYVTGTIKARWARRRVWVHISKGILDNALLASLKPPFPTAGSRIHSKIGVLCRLSLMRWVSTC